jgi:hypothetical protein
MAEEEEEEEEEEEIDNQRGRRRGGDWGFIQSNRRRRRRRTQPAACDRVASEGGCCCVHQLRIMAIIRTSFISEKGLLIHVCVCVCVCVLCVLCVLVVCVCARASHPVLKFRVFLRVPGQTRPHQPLLVVSHTTCPPLFPSPHAISFVIGPAVIKSKKNKECACERIPQRCC